MGRPLLQVMCNGDGGHFAYRAEALQIGMAEFEAMNDPAPRFVELDRSIRLSGKVWPVISGKEYYGNWYWNAYTLGDGRKTPVWCLVDFLKWLRPRDLFQITMGPDALFEWYREERVLSDAELHTAILNALADGGEVTAGTLSSTLHNMHNATCAHCGAGLTLPDPDFDIPVCDTCAAKPEGA